MDLCDLARPLPRLPVLQLRHGDEEREVHRERKARAQARADQAGEELVEPLAGEPSVHIGFAEAQRALRQHAAVKRLVLDLDVPGIGSVDLDMRERKEISHDRLGVHDSKPLSAWCERRHAAPAHRTERREASGMRPYAWGNVRHSFLSRSSADFIPRAARRRSTRRASDRAWVGFRRGQLSRHELDMAVAEPVGRAHDAQLSVIRMRLEDRRLWPSAFPRSRRRFAAWRSRARRPACPRSPSRRVRGLRRAREDGREASMLSFSDLMVASIGAASLVPEHHDERRVEDCHGVFEARDHIVIGKISGDPANEEVAAARVEGIFGSDTRIGAAQNGRVRVLPFRQRLALMAEIVALRHALDIAGVPRHQEIERGLRRNDVLRLRRLPFPPCRRRSRRRLAAQ